MGYSLLLSCLHLWVTISRGLHVARDDLCQIDARIEAGCLTLNSVLIRSTIECVVLCQQELAGGCRGVVEGRLSHCYFVADTDCKSDSDDIDEEPCTKRDFLDFRAYLKVETASSNPTESDSTTTSPPPTVNRNLATDTIPKPITPPAPSEGCSEITTWNDHLDRCVCNNGYIGLSCDEYASQCMDLRDAGYVVGDYLIKLNVNSIITKTLCELTEVNVNTYISHSVGSGGYDKTYAEYRNGFFHNGDSFWLGLEVMYQLNQMGLNNLILDVHFEGEGEAWMSYTNVIIGHELTGYIMNYGGTGVKTTNLVGILDGMSCLPAGIGFSTSDHEQNFFNLAGKARSGWWFLDVHQPCNPNGLAYASFPSPILGDHVAIHDLAMHQEPNGPRFQYVSFYFQE